MCGFMSVFEGEGEEKLFANLCVYDISIWAEMCLSLSAVDSAGGENNFYPGKEKWLVVSQPSFPYASEWLTLSGDNLWIFFKTFDISSFSDK